MSEDAEDVCVGHHERNEDSSVDETLINLLVALPDEDRFAIAHQPQDLIRYWQMLHCACCF